MAAQANAAGSENAGGNFNGASALQEACVNGLLNGFCLHGVAGYGAKICDFVVHFSLPFYKICLARQGMFAR